MKTTLLLPVLFLLLSACTHSPKAVEAVPGRRPSSEIAASPVDLGKMQERRPGFQKLDSVFNGAKVTTKELDAILSQISADPEFTEILMRYRSDTYRAVGVDDPFIWIQNNPEHFGALTNYIDPQNDGEPIWRTTNRKLRNDEVLTQEESEFKEAMLRMMQNLPPVIGTMFRGATLKPGDLTRYVAGHDLIERPFISTSVDPQIAQKFAPVDPAGVRVSVIFVMRSLTGTPISAFHPGNNHELEVLLKPALNYHVDQVIWGRDHKATYIFMSEK